MRQTYDADADAFYVRFSDDRVEESEEVAPGIVLDYDADNRIVGMEVLNASVKMAAGAFPVAAE